jgi:NAD/NADP transhydrogenase alpha subunit
MTFSLGANWKTSLSGLIAAAGAFVLFAAAPPYSVHFPTWITAAAGFIAAGGLAAMGLAAKDNNVTGGSVVQPGIPVAPVPPVAPPAASQVQRVPGSKW